MDVSAPINKADEVEIEEPKFDDAALDFSIGTVSSAVLQGLLRSICETIPEAKNMAIQHLLVTKAKVPISPDSKWDQNANKDINASDQELGRRRPRYSQCENCKKEFDTLENTPTACRYHTEEACADEDSHLFVDNDFFGPDEADCDDELRKEYPECFVFECCDGNLRDNPDGCETDWHKEATSHVVARSEHMARVAPETHVAKKARIL
ncbi:hypothetical protein N7494_002740 [Penicillium frequentans]|uniref:C2H2-type domain-containing protein n=1 Tax=Penicillium frequentans TaxID=3151616 RepID=A0AAD6GI56_9EURO|nr:hypothetical protein N7494_002740 [Penicillium glabrum]